MSNTNDFIIENGVLTKYIGPGGDVVIPEGVAHIGEGAFAGSGVRRVFMPESVKRMDAAAFSDCKKLEQARLSDQIEVIPDSAFRRCVNLQEVTFPTRLREIGAYAFQKDSRLASAVLPEGLLVVGEGAFKDCGGLSKYGPMQRIELPSTLRRILDDAFACNVKTMVFQGAPDLVVYARAFRGVIDTLVVPETVASIPTKTFDCLIRSFDFRSAETRVSETIVRGESRMNALIPVLLRSAFPKQLPLRLRKKAAPLAAKMILSGAFPEQALADTWLKTIRQNADTLEEQIMEEPDLRELMLRERMVSASAAQKHLEATQDSALRLELLNYLHGPEAKAEPAPDALDPDRVPTLAELRKIFKIDIRDGRARITGCKSDAEDVVIPAAAGKAPVTEIGERAFSEQKHLRSVTIPEGVLRIGAYAFDHCPQLTEISVPASAQQIGAKAFRGVKRLEDEQGLMIVNHCLIDYSGTAESVVVPEGVRAIVGAFSAGPYHGVRQAELPGSLTSLQDGAFRNCPLGQIVLPEGLTEIGNQVFFGCGNLKRIQLPSTLRSIGDEAFVGCEQLSELALPEGLVRIGRRAFSFCSSLTRLAIPKSVTEIAKNAFGEPWERRSPGLTIHAPAGSCAEQYAKENNIPFAAE